MRGFKRAYWAGRRLGSILIFLLSLCWVSANNAEAGPGAAPALPLSASPDLSSISSEGTASAGSQDGASVSSAPRPSSSPTPANTDSWFSSLPYRLVAVPTNPYYGAVNKALEFDSFIKVVNQPYWFVADRSPSAPHSPCFSSPYSPGLSGLASTSVRLCKTALQSCAFGRPCSSNGEAPAPSSDPLDSQLLPPSGGFVAPPQLQDPDSQEAELESDAPFKFKGPQSPPPALGNRNTGVCGIIFYGHGMHFGGKEMRQYTTPTVWWHYHRKELVQTKQLDKVAVFAPLLKHRSYGGRGLGLRRMAVLWAKMTQPLVRQLREDPECKVVRLHMYGYCLGGVALRTMMTLDHRVWTKRFRDDKSFEYVTALHKELQNETNDNESSSSLELPNDSPSANTSATPRSKMVLMSFVTAVSPHGGLQQSFRQAFKRLTYDPLISPLVLNGKWLAPLGGFLGGILRLGRGLGYQEIQELLYADDDVIICSLAAAEVQRKYDYQKHTGTLLQRFEVVGYYGLLRNDVHVHLNSALGVASVNPNSPQAQALVLRSDELKGRAIEVCGPVTPLNRRYEMFPKSFSAFQDYDVCRRAGNRSFHYSFDRQERLQRTTLRLLELQNFERPFRVWRFTTLLKPLPWSSPGLRRSSWRFLFWNHPHAFFAGGKSAMRDAGIGYLFAHMAKFELFATPPNSELDSKSVDQQGVDRSEGNFTNILEPDASLKPNDAITKLNTGQKIAEANESVKTAAGVEPLPHSTNFVETEFNLPLLQCDDENTHDPLSEELLVIPVSDHDPES
eukprot:GHVT01039340.1.p1 GENE.GHVT01039340.1~~GHVT01039340.1.p1  ORF type:complete len:839 (-),score=130.35 GHVT01039340.1:110-2473(-)